MGGAGWGEPQTLKTDFCWSPHRTRACRRLRRFSAGRGWVPAHGSSRLWKSWWLGAGELRVMAAVEIKGDFKLHYLSSIYRRKRMGSVHINGACYRSRGVWL